MIASQRPDATQVVGFNTWKSLGRFVKKDDKGIVIIAPMSIPPHGGVHDGATPADLPAKPILRFRGVPVFDIAQSDGEPLPEHATVTGDPAEHLIRLKAHIADLSIALDHDDLPTGVDGSSRGKRISIRGGLAPANEFSVLAHELLHRGDDRPKSKTVRETESEAVAFVVSQAVGLATGTAASDYIQLYQGDTDTLAASLERVQRVAAGIIAAVNAATDQHRGIIAVAQTVTPSDHEPSARLASASLYSCLTA